MVSFERCRCLLADPRKRFEYLRQHCYATAGVRVREPEVAALGQRNRRPIALPYQPTPQALPFLN